MPVSIIGRLSLNGDDDDDFGLGSFSVASWKAVHLDAVPLESWVVIG